MVPKVEYYDGILTKKAEELYLQRHDIPLGNGIGTDEKLELETYTFYWDSRPLKTNQEVDNRAGIGNRKTQGRWTVEIETSFVHFGENCSRNDAVTWLNAFQNIAKILWDTTLTDPNLIFEVGMPAIELGKSCVGMASGNHTMFPLGKNNCNLICVWTENAAKVLDLPNKEKTQLTLEKIILHEIGHTLRRYPELHEIREKLKNTIFTGFRELKETLEEISPHYLGKQFYSIPDNLEGKRIIAIAENKEPEDSKNIAGEVFAEIVRHYYLEAYINKIARTPPTKKTIVTPLLDVLIKNLQEKRIRFPNPPEKNPHTIS
jgi:hypothetical protein